MFYAFFTKKIVAFIVVSVRQNLDKCCSLTDGVHLQDAQVSREFCRTDLYFNLSNDVNKDASRCGMDQIHLVYLAGSHQE